ncbi:unnamed protein product [Clonostachys rhizophaga]|uniref:Uncharacterized protein n=1 Tax=Clonostachys rhizophaga TaxID=160324 RepID=A0A9N9VNK8_9HYPO|nr:unnamed protein product [Clonostachys rhizophaga]
MSPSIDVAMGCPPDICMIDRIPDEILIHILRDLLAGDMATGDTNPEQAAPAEDNVEYAPLWLEHCVDIPRFHMTSKVPGWDFLPEFILEELMTKPTGQDAIDERNETTPCQPPARPSQAKHINDWLIVNSTCRRFRRLGKPVFFAEKRIMMSANLGERLQQGVSFFDYPPMKRVEEYVRHREFAIEDFAARRARREVRRRQDPSEATYTKVSPKPEINFGPMKLLGLSVADQALALAQTQDIILMGTRLTTPSMLVGLPKFLSAFPRLRSCWLMLGYESDAESGTFKIHRADRENEDHVCGIAARMRDLLLDIGLSPSLELAFAVSDSYLWDQQEHFLTNETFSLLRVKKQMMQRTKKLDPTPDAA